MAKKVLSIIKLALPAGKATPAPPVGPVLGQHGLNIMMFCKEYNARTGDQAGLIILRKVQVNLIVSKLVRLQENNLKKLRRKNYQI